MILAPPAPGSLDGLLTWANASIDTPMGRVSSAWSAAERAYSLHVAVPPNARARVVVPVAPSFTITESDAVVWAGGQFAASEAVGGITRAAVGADGRSVAFEVGSGDFAFNAAKRRSL